MSKEITVYECTFCIQDENGNDRLFHAPNKDFSHLVEYVTEEDLMPIVLFKEKSKAQEVLELIHFEWGENWDLVVDFFGQEIADAIDKVIGYES